MNGKMLGRCAEPIATCNCKKHHKPTRAWTKAARSRQRAREKQQMRKEER